MMKGFVEVRIPRTKAEFVRSIVGCSTENELHQRMIEFECEGAKVAKRFKRVV